MNLLYNIINLNFKFKSPFHCGFQSIRFQTAFIKPPCEIRFETGFSMVLNGFFFRD